MALSFPPLSLPRSRFALLICLAFTSLFTLLLFHRSSSISPFSPSEFPYRSSLPPHTWGAQNPDGSDRGGDGGWFPGSDGMGGNGTHQRRANATYVILVRNSELYGLLGPMQSLEDRFNHWGGYPYVFLNDEPFTDEFKRHTRAVASTECHYGLIDKKIWNQPSWINETRATESRKKMSDQGIIYADSVSYRNMCRFNSGFFFRHPLLQSFKFYWRIEPDVQFFCDIHTDPFLEMQDEEKVYGFLIAMYEFRETIETLWESTREFMALYPQYIAKGNSIGAISDDGGNEYNNCHFWSNFEIADMDFWRSDAYMDYFNFLDKKGGFYYERWGDAPVHSIAAALFLPKDKIKFFDNHGYRHSVYQRCPMDKAHDIGRCTCRESDTFDNDEWSCLPKWKAIHPGLSWPGSHPK